MNGTAIIFFVFLGFDTVTMMSEETRARAIRTQDEEIV
jgi:amino acid transporter